ncbi:primosomal replication protein N, partial [uncultured Parasutterella sp.]
MLNSVELEGELEKKEALRYSLAGVPILEFTIRYKGIVQEGGAERVLNFSAAAMAVGETAKKVSELELGSERIFKG